VRGREKAGERDRERERERKKKKRILIEERKKDDCGGGQTSEKGDGEKGTGINTRRGKKGGIRRREDHVRKREIAKESEGEEEKTL